MPLKLDATYRCDWVRENNGIVQSIWVPVKEDWPVGPYPIMVNSARAAGIPKVGDTGTIQLNHSEAT